MKLKVYLILGSNEGNREENISRAISMLEERGITITKKTPLVETEPEDAPPQRNFLNAAVECETEMDAFSLLKLTQEIEKQLGRERKGDLSPRPIDIDIAFYGEKVIISPELQVPHPSSTVRNFSLSLLMQLCPEFIHPVEGKKIEDLAKGDKKS